MFNNITIKSQLMFVTGLLSVLLVSIGGLGLYGTNQANDRLRTVYLDRAMPLIDLAGLLDGVQRSRLNVLLAANLRNVAGAKQRIELIAKLDVEIKNRWQIYMTTVLTPEEKILANNFIRQWAAYRTSRNRTMNFVVNGDFNAAINNLATDAMKKFGILHTTLSALIKLQGDIAAQEHAQAQSDYEKIFMISTIASSLGVLLIVLIGFLLIRAIVTPLNKAIAIANSVASGDLTSHIDVNSTKGAGKLLQALKKMDDNLIDLVDKVRLNTDSITTAACEIVSGNTDLSQRTEEQASSLEETSASMAELTVTVKQNANNAQQANQLAAGASEVALKGGILVDRIIQTMGSINQGSKRIVDIISVIDGIAFQTNILALNAAVEAARAGDQGRGFAVVAAEVRTLAQRSATAAKEIKALIHDSVDKVEKGTRLVDEAGITMDEIVTAVKRVTDIMAEIAIASREQSSGIEHVNQAVAQMDEITQQNAALAEEVATAAESMQEQAQDLLQAVMVFKLVGGMAPVPIKRSNRIAGAESPPFHSVGSKTITKSGPIPTQLRKESGDDGWEKF
ncbi:methyl-accepting chemotaxis protein-1, serine sensor receptor [Nitrosomonas cryotolerans]|uniref:Methyl-accepting chemotaxis protein-1, serine sensor receptor n=1 Tax=Nitrosomonas cryotolerans ATCC 49181 TaxID=1131553 RepID=A0A1N6I6K5_9PROT|nr:methyl-accepting chemotaxis protein [Nitrosomonas cryotolerans]SFP91128.1 methyl-accepting chemotaxis protein-1, serine sensor receptor [Nitrosomonas cryotolerans]SIO27676.1 methyl-accepting chemotaxis protein-1, serine sensor receptor [Nitrosomonas cryotolerans ATCC 49181]